MLLAVFAVFKQIGKDGYLMRKTLWPFVMLAAATAGLAPSAGAAPASNPLLTPEKLLEAEDALFAADLHHDIAAIERGFADEAIFVHANGMTQSKADYIAATRAAKFPARSITTEGRVARVFGTTGVVRGIKKLEVGEMHLSGSYLTVYILRDGRWQMLDEQSAPTFTPRPDKSD